MNRQRVDDDGSRSRPAARGGVTLGVAEDHYIVDEIAGGLAMLRDKAGAHLTLPESWLPQATRQGAVVIASSSTSEDASSQLSFRLAQGTTTPEGTDVGA